MRENVKVSKIDKKKKQTIKKKFFLQKKCCIFSISFEKMPQNEST